MNTDTALVEKLLTELGLDEEKSKLYLALVEQGELTVLELARITGFPRTRVYRLLEDMETAGFIEEMVDQKRKKARAVGIEGLERLAKEQEEKAKSVSLLLPEVAAYLSGQAGLRAENTKVLFYRGHEGIKRIIWNVLRAHGECLGYLYVNVDTALGHEMAEDWRTEAVKRGIHFRDITSDYHTFTQSDHTQVSGYLELCQTRYISPQKLTIDHQVDIYNNVIALYSWKEGDVFGVEIYNPTVVTLQKQIHHLLWNIAKKR